MNEFVYLFCWFFLNKKNRWPNEFEAGEWQDCHQDVDRMQEKLLKTMQNYKNTIWNSKSLSQPTSSSTLTLVFVWQDNRFGGHYILKANDESKEKHKQFQPISDRQNYFLVCRQIRSDVLKRRPGSSFSLWLSIFQIFKITKNLDFILCPWLSFQSLRVTQSHLFEPIVKCRSKVSDTWIDSRDLLECFHV